MKTVQIKKGITYELLMRLALRMGNSKCRGFKSESDKYEIIVTIRVKEQQK